jgi:hypothetical protein
MSLSRSIFLPCAIICVLVLAVLVVSRNREPQYEGRTLSDWLAQVHLTSGTQKEEAEAAVRAVGDEAVPYLLSYVRYESNRPKMMIGAFVERHGIRVLHVPKGWTEPGRIQQMGVDGFRALGDKCIGAIPSLALHLTNGPFHANAAFALAGIGPASLPALVNALDSEYQQARFGAVSALGHLGAAARPAVPAMLQLYERDPGMRAAIRNELMFIDQDMLAKLDKGEQAAAPNAALPHR